MAKFLFIVLPSLGHLNPTMAIASELKKRKHHVGYATGTDVRYSIESEGHEFFQAGPPGMKSQISDIVRHLNDLNVGDCSFTNVMEWGRCSLTGTNGASTDSANFRCPHYHTGSDTIEHVDFDFVKKVAQTSLLTMIAMAEEN